MSDFADCSIVMLAHNGAEFTRTALESIRRAAVLPRQLLLVDNGSSDDTPEVFAAQIPRLREVGIQVDSWTNAENKGCSVARNEAWEQATQPYVAFCDNDIAVCTADWLRRLQQRMDADPQLGVLGPKLIYPFKPHPIQCAGVAVNPLGRIRFRGRGALRDDPRYAAFERVPVLISACWLHRRDLLAEVGGLDPLFHPVQYEDLDFCMRVNQAGYYCAYTPEVEVYHFEGITTASVGDFEYARNIAAQSGKFRERWAEVFREYPQDPEDYRWLPRQELGLSDELDLSLC